MFTEAYINTAGFLLDTYDGAEPFHLYLKKYFAAHKKFGSRDRKHITQLCYCWYRAGKALQHLDRRAQFMYALFLCSDGENKLLAQTELDLHKEATKRLAEKLQFIDDRIGFNVRELFPWNAELSPEIECDSFNRSLLIQPDLFLRLRPGKEEIVSRRLQQHNLFFETVSPHCIALNNSTKIDAVVKLDEEAVVQDLNSQNVLNVLTKHYEVLKKFAVWDCCAASGGKSLLLMDTFANARLTVSDVRQTILHNLHKRFQKAGIKAYQWFVSDATKAAPPQNQLFDLILCDAPCSGSGTWSRTPEQLHYFPASKIDSYAQLQKDIVNNVSRYLKPGGLLLYSTCSVFFKENEEVVHAVAANGKLNFLESAYYKGYDKKADTLFAALFKAL